MKFRKIKLKAKRVIAGFMAAVTLFLSVFNANTLPVQAAEVTTAFVLTEELVALIQMFLASMGIVVSKSEIQSSNYEGYINNVIDGFTQNITTYGVDDVIDWSNPAQIGLLSSSMMLNAHEMLEEELEEIGAEPSLSKSALAHMMMIDSICYGVLGTAASKAYTDGVEWMRDASDNIVGYTRRVKGNLAEVVDFREFKAHLSQIGSSNSSGDDDNNDDDWDEKYQKRIKKFIVNGGLLLIWLAEATGVEDLSNSGRKPGTTEFTEFDPSVFSMPEELYYSGYEMINGQYVYRANAVCRYDSGSYEVKTVYELGNEPVAAYLSGDKGGIGFMTLINGSASLKNFNIKNDIYLADGSFYGSSVENRNDFSGGSSISSTANVPIFSTMQECQSFLRGEIDDSTALNKLNFDFGDYKNFLNTVPQGSYLGDLLSACTLEDGTIDEEAFWALSNQLEKAATGADDAPALGTSQGYDDFKTYYEELTPNPDPAPGPVPDPDPEPGTDPTPAPDNPSDPEAGKDYSGVLASILSAIMSLPELIFKAFKALLTDIFNAILSIPQEIIAFFTDPVAFIQEKIQGIFTTVEGLWDNGKSILENIILLPGKIAEAFGFPEFSAMIEAGIQSLLDAMQFNRLIESLERGFAGVLDAVTGLLFDPASILLSLEAFKEGVLGKIDSVIDALKGIADAMPGADGSGGSEEEPPEPDDDDGFEIGDFFKLFIYLILILLMLIVIFVNCLKFIVMIFKVPATTGFLPDDMVSAITFLKELEIAGMGISVYDFSIFLINLMLVFAVIRLLRREIAHFRIPRKY